MSHEYENVRRVVYGEGACFVPVCEKCFRFVKRDKEVWFRGDGTVDESRTNAECKKCGRTKMLYEGFY